MLDDHPPGNNNSIQFLWIAVAVLIIVGFFFSLAEASFNCLNEFTLKTKADEGDKRARFVLKLHKRFDETLITNLIGLNVVTTVISAISTILFANIFSNLQNADTISTIVSTAVMSFVVYIFCDTIPKLIGKAIPNNVTMILCYPLSFFIIIFYPITFIFTLLVKGLKKLFRLDKEKKITHEEFEGIVDQIEKQGDLEKDESSIIKATIDFDDTKVTKILTPIKKVKMIDISRVDTKSLIKLLDKTDFSRIPVYEKNPNNVLGVITVKTFLYKYYLNNNINIREELTKPYIVSSNSILEKILDGFNTNKTHIALVKNKDEKIIGMVTMDDVLEELVGNLNTNLKTEGELNDK